MALGVSHQRGVNEPQIKISIPQVYLGRSSHQASSHELDNVLASRDRRQKCSPRIAIHARSQQLIHLDDDWIQDDELPSQLSHESGSEMVGVVTAVRRGDQRTRIGNYLQSVGASSRR